MTKQIGGDPVCAGSGNPINVITGNKYQREVDLPALPGVLGLEIVRHYNSVYSRNSSRSDTRTDRVGQGWRLSYQIELKAHGNTVQIVQADGTPLSFAKGFINPQQYLAANPADGHITPTQTSRGREYLWHQLNGQQLSFDAEGHLLQIKTASGEFVSLQYDPQGLLLQVSDPQGRSLHLHYPERKSAHSQSVQSIDTPVGRFSYEYAGPQLVKATAPGADDAHRVSRLYHYEDPRFPTQLTGISVDGAGSDGQPMHQRISTWLYDATGKGALSVKGQPARLQTGANGQPSQPHRLVEGTGIEQVVLDHSQPGQTTATNSLGQTTVFTHTTIAGQTKLLEVRGAGCAHCAGPNLRYGYDKLGRLTDTTQITLDGQPIQTRQSTLDLYGRTQSVSRIDYRDGKAQPAQRLVRYEYAGTAPEPTLIARPSVIAGQEHITRIAYNETGQPTKITEEGFSPLTEQGQPSSQGSPISRTTTYRYSTINGRSVLAEVDGPLANGPKGEPSDSDITRYEWDSRGSFVTTVHSPGGFNSTVQYDLAGRLNAVTGPSGFTDHTTYMPLGPVASRKQSRAEQVLTGTAYRYDALGRATEQLAIVGNTGREVPQSAQGFDIADRLLWQADREGKLRQARYDVEGHLLSSIVQTGGMRQEERYAYDAFGRLERVEDNAGTTRRLLRDAAGHITATVDPLGRVTRYSQGSQDSDSRAWQVTQAANTNKPLAVRYGLDPSGRVNEVTALAGEGTDKQRTLTTGLKRDDFGREVAVVSPDSGTVIKQYDAADRLVRIQDALGATTDNVYDAAGRVIRRTVAQAARVGAEKGVPQTTLFVYEGTRLVEIQHPNQSERYTYDPLGRVASKTVRLNLGAGAQATSMARYRYDEQGRLVAQTLPDGSELQYQRNGQGQIIALFKQTNAWAPFGWGRTALVTNLERDLIGLRSATYGNGVVGQWQRSREGVLARVLYTSPSRRAGALQAALESLLPDAQAAESATPPAPRPMPGAYGLPPQPRALWDSRLLFDAAGNIVMQGQFADSAAAQPAQTSYAYDALNQLAQAAQAGVPNGSARSVADTVSANLPSTVWRYHHDSLGNRLLAQQGQPIADMGHTVKLHYAEQKSDRLAEQAMDASGQPLADGERQYTWDAAGQLAAVEQPGKAGVRYRYNHRGLRVSKQVGDKTEHYLYDERRQRLAELDAQGRIKRQYVWLAGQLIAVIDLAEPRGLESMVEGSLGQIGRTIQTAWRQWTSTADSVAFVHVNHLGAPVVMTNANATPVWRADYAPFGKRLSPMQTGLLKASTAGDMRQTGAQGMRLDLRLPGQWQDEETGLHYNDQRYYDPERGRYLSPDPLGLGGGLNAYAYVSNNPMGFSDPMGLVLFAFDGTGNSETARPGDSISNVRKFLLGYDEASNGRAFYITGIGTTNADMPYAGNMATGDGFDQRVQLGFDFLEKYIDGDTGTAALDIDTVGFSRGAAEARVWTNLLLKAMDQGAYTTAKGHTRCLNLRFEGLWDSVPHLGALHGNEKKYDFSIPSAVKYAVQAVALNEHRGGPADFDMRSIFANPASSSAPGRMEMGFVGSHSDIGGGYGTGDLSDVALMWMVQQGKSQGIKFDQDRIDQEGWSVVSNPILHDKSPNKELPKMLPPSLGDRDVIYGDGTQVKEGKVVIGGNTTKWARGYVDYYDEWCGPIAAPAVGAVDMNAYSAWLGTQGVNIKFTPPASPHLCN